MQFIVLQTLLPSPKSYAPYICHKPCPSTCTQTSHPNFTLLTPVQSLYIFRTLHCPLPISLPIPSSPLLRARSLPVPCPFPGHPMRPWSHPASADSTRCVVSWYWLLLANHCGQFAATCCCRWWYWLCARVIADGIKCASPPWPFLNYRPRIYEIMLDQCFTSHGPTGRESLRTCSMRS